MTVLAASRYSKAVTIWLGFMVILVLTIIAVGGATRLTNSGLSITEWRPISGALPPLSMAEWHSEFEKYKQIPEFLAEHPDMDLDGFKFIYFMEWGHRQLGRLIGLAYLLPLIIFWLQGKLRRRARGRFVAILLLIGLQGAVGWWMVHSGLQDGRVDVAPVRLAAHLGLAFILLGLLVWTFLDQKQEWPPAAIAPQRRLRMTVLLFLVFAQVISGALVAGNHAGKAYNTWPAMDGGFVPNGYMQGDGALIVDIGTVQFNHRILAYLIFILAVFIWATSYKHKAGGEAQRAHWILAVVLVQMVLGIAALLNMAALPIALAHQAGAAILFTICIWSRRGLSVHYRR